MVNARQRTEVAPELAGNRFAMAIIRVVRGIEMAGLAGHHVHDEKGSVEPLRIGFEPVDARDGYALIGQCMINGEFDIAFGNHQARRWCTTQDQPALDGLTILMPTPAQPIGFLAATALNARAFVDLHLARSRHPVHEIGGDALFHVDHGASNIPV